MGVTILQPYLVPENKTGAQTIEALTKQLTALGAVQAGHFLVDCETYMSSIQQIGNPPKTVHVLHSMTPHYTSKKQTKTESKGPRFELGDFLIKLGSVTMSQSFKGILVEVEYRPCILPVSCWELMREFLQGFLGNCVPNTIPSYFTNHNRINEIYQPLDTIQQYLEHFTNYRKQTTPAVGMRQ
uniref:Mediator of RNA polymerase II transcription subunit 20 n=1 Tax=Phlebotomus papatasi TaxID=29031 RepID=A0A1B0D487_PHLPP